MLISIPTKALENYISRCHEAWETESVPDFDRKCYEAHAYADCIKDICGLAVWGEVVRNADMSFPEGVECCCGVPFNPKKGEVP